MKKPTTRKDSVAESLGHETGQIFIWCSAPALTAGGKLAAQGLTLRGMDAYRNAINS
jgi:hypothetical protein